MVKEFGNMAVVSWGGKRLGSGRPAGSLSGPRTPKEDRKCANFNARITPEVKAEIERAADNFSMSAASMSQVLLKYALAAYQDDPAAFDVFLQNEMAARYRRKE